MNIQKLTNADDRALFEMLRKEGDDWACYHAGEAEARYRRALARSFTLVAYEDEILCGYIRVRDDDGFGVYVYDLLVDKDFRGRNIGKALVDAVCAAFPHDAVYVMSGADGYYEKQGYCREGSIFSVQIPKSGPAING